MSTFVLEQLSDRPVVLLTLNADYVAERDLSESNPAVYHLLESAVQPVYYVIDSRQTNFNVNDMIQTAATTSRGSMSTFNHPNVCGVIVITENEAVKMALNGLNSEAFGFVKVHVAHTLEEALSTIHSS